MHTIDDLLTGNQLLETLSRAERARLEPSLSIVSLKQFTVINEPGDEIGQIYFPHTGMVSLLVVMRDGEAVETATIGREGAVGLMAGLGLHITQTRAVVQVPLIATQIAAVPFRKAVHASDALRDIIVRYNEALFGQVQLVAACNALHPIQARLARWILQTVDRVDEATVPLTQELLSQMLGVRRSSISEIASKLQDLGLIRYRRGAIEVLDREGLETVACECYGMIKERASSIAC